MKKGMRRIEILSFVIGMQQHGGERFRVTFRHTGRIGNKLMDHAQFAPEKPVKGIDPEKTGQEMAEQVVIGMSPADMSQLVGQYFPVDRVFRIGPLWPE